MPEKEKLNLIEVFRTGTHTDSAGSTGQWTEADLDRIAEKYNSQSEYSAPLVIGHPQTDSPAYGWTAFLERVGDRLFAAVENVNDKVREAVRSGMFRTVSIALYADGLLRHIGLLGATPPAVKGLTPVEFGNAVEYKTYTYEERVMPEKEKEKEKGEGRPEDKDAEIAKLKAEIAALKKQNAEFAQANEGLLRGKNKLAADLDTQKFSTEIDALILEGKVLPAEKENLTAEFHDLHGVDAGRQFSEGQETLTQRQIKRLKARPVLIPPPAGKQFATSNQAAPKTGEDQTDQNAKEWLKKNPEKTYEDAVRAVVYGGE